MWIKFLFSRRILESCEKSTIYGGFGCRGNVDKFQKIFPNHDKLSAGEVDKILQNAHFRIDMEINFGKIITKIMSDRGLNQLQLSKIIGIRQSQVSNWIHNKSLPGYYSTKLICVKLNVSAAEILGENEGE